MAMQVNGDYGRFSYFRTDDTERIAEKQIAERTGNVKNIREAAKAAEGKETEKKEAEKWSAPQDEYISSEKSGRKPTGLYRIGQDENGNRKIFYENPKAEEPQKPGAPEKPGKSEERCVGNTDKVDREIKKLKEKKQELMRQIQSASGDEKKIRELEKKLAQVEQELSQKDNDTYRRQHSVFSRTT